jgi:hypothetical protein
MQSHNGTEQAGICHLICSSFCQTVAHCWCAVSFGACSTPLFVPFIVPRADSWQRGTMQQVGQVACRLCEGVGPPSPYLNGYLVPAQVEAAATAAEAAVVGLCVAVAHAFCYQLASAGCKQVLLLSSSLLRLPADC